MNTGVTKSLPRAGLGSPSALRAGVDQETFSASSRACQDPWGLESNGENQIKERPMYSMERYGMVAARVLVAMIFMMTTLNVIGQTFAEHEMAAQGVPASLIPVLIVAARALQLVAGVGLILGIYPRISALALLLFLIPATLLGHAFWQAVGTSLYPVQLINFFKNVCMAGGLIFIIAARSQPVLLPRPRRAD